MDKLKSGTRFLSYRLDRCIGKGAFGCVWSAQQEGSGQIVAIKFEYPTLTKSFLNEEAEITKEISSCESFPHYYGNGIEQGFHYLIIEMLGMSLRAFQENHTGGILSLNEVGPIAVSMVKAIQNFHNMGFVHRDIKPSNFVFRGRPDQNELCLIDFGLAKRWRSPDGEVYKPRENVGFRGTSRYASINSHDGYDLGRRDDLWSFFYVLIELCAPPLPWKTQNDKDAVAQIKKRGVARLCTGLPSQFEDIANHISSLGFADDPDYDLIIQKLDEVIEGAEAGSDNGVCLSEEYGSMALIVAPNCGSVFGSSSAVEGSWDNGEPAAAQEAYLGDTDNGEAQKKGCCNLL
ncbi:CK1 family protein kinase [Histomonas meleagridis]|uniref:CK1 family protein kinase n=1 Tax=Histomonas meleagridis TaxID=135588 RepID=UPI00355AC954|nr:CK1 family protein kinase [Histomonas meleagridis]KAH0805783.1 CK1 family protein kinase [Histomonas meleagridis]